MFNRHFLFSVFAVCALAGCRIEVTVPEGGSVETASTAYSCAESAQCSIAVQDTGFNETFVATPNEGFLFSGWRKQHLGLCGGSLEPCQLDASLAADSPALMALIESDQAVYLEAQFLPEDQIRRYEPGDMVYFEGSFASGAGLFPAGDDPVEGRLDIGATTLQHDGFAVMEGRLRVSSLDGELLLEASMRFWQDGLGGVHQLTDENGNVFLDTASNEQGIPCIPAPMEPFTSIEVVYSAMWGGHTTTPLTDGSRSIRVAETLPVSVPLGDFAANAVTVQDEYSYLVSFDDYKKGQTVKSERTLTVSQAKGLVRLDIDRQLYSDSGALLETLTLSLEAVGFNF